MSCYVLKSKKYGYVAQCWDGYFTGHTFIYEGEKYASVSRDISKAKKYTNKKRAENACKKYYYSIVNYEFEVEEIKSEE